MRSHMLQNSSIDISHQRSQRVDLCLRRESLRWSRERLGNETVVKLSAPIAGEMKSLAARTLLPLHVRAAGARWCATVVATLRLVEDRALIACRCMMAAQAVVT